MKATCEHCNYQFEIRRPERVHIDLRLAIITGTGLNMAYVGHMNRDYALCPKCGKLEHQFRAEARDQEEDFYYNNEKVPTKVLRKDIARDGGTVRLTTDAGVFHIDRRIGTKTRDAVFYTNEQDETIFASDSLTKIIHELSKNFLS